MVIGRWEFVRAVGAFCRDRRANVAMLWGLTGTVLIGMLGLTVDFTRAEMIRSRMQNAADAAALVAERSSSLPMSQRTNVARSFFDAELGPLGAQLTFEFNLTQMPEGGHRVTARAPMPVTLARLVRTDDWHLSVMSEAEASASPPIEVVLALDNTGSMSNDMDALRDGAQDLAEFLLSLDGDSVKVGLVPFVAQVNIGSSNTQWIDTAGNNPYNGIMLEGRYLGYRPTSGGGCTSASHPSTFGGFPVRWIQGAASHPAPYTNTSRCYAFSPESVNMWSLYANLPSNAQWGGCVEMRPPPYDITDDAPSTGTPATMWVPYFSLDDGGDVGSPPNNWITSSTFDSSNPLGVTSWTANSATHVTRSLGVYRYRSGVTVSVDTSNTAGRGPNRGCPTPIVPLTTNDNTVINAIQNMLHWNGGGTNQIEGLAWAWRVLSPSAPFTQGKPYNDPNDPVRKVIVLFTDGDNTNLNNNNSAFQSDYAGIGYRSLYTTYQTAQVPTGSVTTPTWQAGLASAWRRPGITNGATAVNYINVRQLQLCQSIRNTGIEIYAIGYDITAGGAAEQLLQQCVTQDGEHYFSADNAAELQAAFDAIGTGIGALRLTH
ncbi:MAG: VWA domain-containing protein [Hyphomonadaceae bacterium]|nr:VWA domain-containing protein [Hyphomonadaceae bacterium]